MHPVPLKHKQIFIVFIVHCFCVLLLYFKVNWCMCPQNNQQERKSEIHELKPKKLALNSLLSNMQARARKICVIRLCTKLQRAQTLTTLDHTFTKLMQHATVLFSASNVIVFFEVVWQHLNINVCLLNINVPVITLPILLDCILKFIISDYKNLVQNSMI